MSWELRTSANCDPATGLGALPARSVDVVLADLPYSARVHAGSRRGRPGGGGAPRDLGFPPLTARERAAMAHALARIVRRWVVVFGDHDSIHGL